MAKKIKVSRKKIKGPDEFLTFTDKMLDYLVERKSYMLIILGGVLLAGFIAAGANYSIRRNREESQKLLSEAIAIFASPVGTEINYQQLVSGIKPFPDRDSKFKAIIDKLEELIKKYPNSKARVEAEFYLGKAYYEKRDYANAINAYEEFLKRADRSSKNVGELKSSAYIALAGSYYNQKNYEKALEYYGKLLESKNSAQEPEALMASADCYIKLGKIKEAEEMLKKLQENYPDTFYANLARLKSAELEK